MALIAQSDSNPTRKLTAATAGSALVSILGLVLKNLAPGWYDPEVLLSVTPIVIFACGWFIRDQANVVVKVEP